MTGPVLVLGSVCCSWDAETEPLTLLPKHLAKTNSAGLFQRSTSSVLDATHTSAAPLRPSFWIQDQTFMLLLASVQKCSVEDSARPKPDMVKQSNMKYDGEWYGNNSKQDRKNETLYSVQHQDQLAHGMPDLLQPPMRTNSCYFMVTEISRLLCQISLGIMVPSVVLYVWSGVAKSFKNLRMKNAWRR